MPDKVYGRCAIGRSQYEVASLPQQVCDCVSQVSVVFDNKNHFLHSAFLMYLLHYTFPLFSRSISITRKRILFVSCSATCLNALERSFSDPSTAAGSMKLQCMRSGSPGKVGHASRTRSQTVTMESKD